MATIYEEVEALKTQMADVQEELGALSIDVQLMQPAQLEEGDNLNSLSEGVYYIPTAAISNTLLNLPVTGYTGIVEVFTAGVSGEIIQRFTPCLKSSLAVYERKYYDGTWGSWSAGLADSGWNDLTLNEGWQLTSYTTDVPQFRKIGKLVMLRGLVNATSSAGGEITTLPVGYRPGRGAYNRFIVSHYTNEYAAISISVDGKVKDIMKSSTSPRTNLCLNGIMFLTN